MDQLLKTFSLIIRARTVSVQPDQEDPADHHRDLDQFRLLEETLKERFPSVHEQMRPETVSRASLLYTLEGTDESSSPVMLTAHLDVVPAEDCDRWPHPPFSGEVADGRIWGRGTIDYKFGVSAMLQACENLLRSGWRPGRTVYLAFGHDEETGGDSGASGIVRLLKDRGVRLSSVLDEGGYIYSYPWLKRDVAVVGLAEKGYLTLRLTARGVQGHASVPDTVSAPGRLCRCLARLEENQMPLALCRPVQMLLQGTRELLKDPEEPITEKLERYPQGNALLRTTTAITMIRGSSKENIVPPAPHALVNFRAVPGDSSSDILEHVRRQAEGLDIEVEYEDTAHIHEPSSISSRSTPEYAAIAEAMGDTWPELDVVPGIFPAATDSRHYCSIADNVYRFQPVHLGSMGLRALHSAGESVPVEDYLRGIDFYARYLKRVCGG